MKLQELIDKYRYPADASDDPTARQLLEELEGLARPVAMKDLLQQLEELVPLAAAATEGPWQKGSLENGDLANMLLRVFCDDSLGSMVADCTAQYAIGLNEATKAANAAFIAAARNFLTPDNLPKLAAALAAPIEATPLPLSQDGLEEMINEHFGHACWCNREWSAWQVGTMTEDDFSLVSESDVPGELAAYLLTRLQNTAAAAPIEVERGAEWVPVAEGLPEEDQHGTSDYVWVSEPHNGDYGMVFPAGITIGYYRFGTKSWHEAEDGQRINDVTHWRKLPAAPLKGGSQHV